MKGCNCSRCRERALAVQASRWFVVSLCLFIARERGEAVAIELPPAVIASGVNN